ncbi:Afb1 [Kluyveromyces marxianus]
MNSYFLHLLLCFGNFLFCLAADSASSQALNQAKQEAASADINFFIGFISDFNANQKSYTSYMKEAQMTMPQDIADYYFHLQQVTESTQLLEDIATSFPFSDFKTFITAVPWYTQLLSQASITQFYVPDDFMTKQAEVQTSTLSGNITSSYGITTSHNFTQSPTASNFNGNSSTLINNSTSINVGTNFGLYSPLVLLPALCVLFG